MTVHLWDRCSSADSLKATLDRHPGLLQALRRGRNVPPGGHPAMTPFYAELHEDGRLTSRLKAEHVCLVLFGIHQQGKAYPVHHKDVPLGRALSDLKRAGKFSDAALDARVMRLLTAASLDEAAHHLVGLVSQISATKQPIPLGYTQLFYDLCDLQDEAKAPRVRRRWGAAYFHHTSASPTNPKETAHA